MGHLIVLKPDGFKFKIDREDAYLLKKATWADNGRGYVRGGRYYLHRIIAKAPEEMYVDHINRDRSDNRRCNLRVCTRSQNMSNTTKMKRNRTGYKGVYLMSPKNGASGFEAKIGFGGKNLYLGYFKTPEEAARAYNKKALELHGEFAVLNEVK